MLIKSIRAVRCVEGMKNFQGLVQTPFVFAVDVVICCEGREEV